MPLKLHCVCGRTLMVPSKCAGDVIKCPKCSTRILVPNLGHANTLAPISAVSPTPTSISAIDEVLRRIESTSIDDVLKTPPIPTQKQSTVNPVKPATIRPQKSHTARQVRREPKTEVAAKPLLEIKPTNPNPPIGDLTCSPSNPDNAPVVPASTFADPDVPTTAPTTADQATKAKEVSLEPLRVLPVVADTAKAELISLRPPRGQTVADR